MSRKIALLQSGPGNTNESMLERRRFVRENVPEVRALFFEARLIELRARAIDCRWFRFNENLPQD
jgi:hypothetical protein